MLFFLVHNGNAVALLILQCPGDTVVSRKKKNDNAKHTLLKLNIILFKFTTFLEIIDNFICYGLSWLRQILLYE